MSTDQNGVLGLLKGHEQVPVVTFQQQDDPLALMHFLLAQDVNCIEITLRTAYGLPAIKLLREVFGSDVVIGAGTVLEVDQIAALVEVGVDFLVSPGATPALIEGMENSGLAYLPGAVTPSEIMNLREKGLRALKFFPAHLFGGLEALKAYGQLFPDVAFCPTGGINKAISADYLSLSNVFSVGGSWFQKAFGNQEI